MNQKVEKFILSVTESAPEPGPKPAPEITTSPTVLATPKSAKEQTKKYPFITGKVFE